MRAAARSETSSEWSVTVTANEWKRSSRLVMRPPSLEIARFRGRVATVACRASWADLIASTRPRCARMMFCADPRVPTISWRSARSRPIECVLSEMASLTSFMLSLLRSSREWRSALLFV
eukprot:scaffold142150_cov87-Phaeocystis_antarctica.AAC.2